MLCSLHVARRSTLGTRTFHTCGWSVVVQLITREAPHCGEFMETSLTFTLQFTYLNQRACWYNMYASRFSQTVTETLKARLWVVSVTVSKPPTCKILACA